MLICHAIIYIKKFFNFFQKSIDIHIVSLFSVSHYTTILLFLQSYIKGLGIKSHCIEFEKDKICSPQIRCLLIASKNGIWMKFSGSQIQCLLIHKKYYSYNDQFFFLSHYYYFIYTFFILDLNFFVRIFKFKGLLYVEIFLFDWLLFYFLLRNILEQYLYFFIYRLNFLQFSEE